MSPPVFEIGDVLAGKYRIERVIGQGGMGIVLAAQHLQLDELVAIKMLLPEAVGNAELVERFVREARAAIKIKGQNVARVLDVGTLESGTPFLVMEYLRGADLSSELSQKSFLPPELAVEYMLQACEAMAEAHALGIVHRDLKPANLFLSHNLDGSPCIKVLDFGVSKVIGADALEQGKLTRTNVVMGSPSYMSPEQLYSSRDADARSDIWSLGVILFELLTGLLPFEAETIGQLCAQVMQGKAKPLRQCRPELSPELEQIIVRCLEKDPSQRWSDVGELSGALTGLCAEPNWERLARIERMLQSAGAAGPGTDRPRSIAPFVSTKPSFMRAQRPRLWTLLGAMLFGGAAAAVLVYAVVRSSASHSSELPATMRPEVSAAPGPGPDAQSSAQASDSAPISTATSSATAPVSSAKKRPAGPPPSGTKSGQDLDLFGDTQ